MDYRIGFVACFIVGCAYGQECRVFGDPVEGQARQSSTEWKYVHSVIHLHDSLPEAYAFEAVTDANEQLAASRIELSLVDVIHHPVYDGVCFPDNYAEMEAYIDPLQYPTDSFLNIHVFPDFCGSVLGFAFLWYQAGQEADGVYVRTDCFGLSGDLLEGREGNATLVHELGHYFSLFHVFQGVDYCGEEEADCTLVNDRVCDTPPTKLNWSCTNPICPPSLYGYEPNNYMDYYPDSCKTAFTMGQVDRMHSVLPAWRPQIPKEGQYLPGDINNDMLVGVDDLLMMFSVYGASHSQADINKDGLVSVMDLTTLLMHYGQ